MSQPAITTGLDGIVASGNVPTWIIPESALTGITDQTNSIAATVLTAAGTVKADCYHNMGGISLNRTATTRDRKRACDKFTVTRKTGETIEAAVEAIFDQQEEADATVKLNAVYDALPEKSTVYIAKAYGHDSTSATPPKKLDLARGEVTMRAKNPEVEGEDLTFTATLAVDLYLPDITVTTA